jgi:hypothetical protein
MKKNNKQIDPNIEDLMDQAIAKQGNIIPFGKYKGKPLEVLLSDPSYCNWKLSQPDMV